MNKSEEIVPCLNLKAYSLFLSKLAFSFPQLSEMGAGGYG